MVTEPTKDQFIDENGVKYVLRTAADSWRHGSYVTQVFHRTADDTYWQISYRLSTDGETNELSEGIYGCTQVQPYQETVTKYRAI